MYRRCGHGRTDDSFRPSVLVEVRAANWRAVSPFQTSCSVAGLARTGHAQGVARAGHMTGDKRSIDQLVDAWRSTVMARCRPFQMYTFCSWCGKDQPRDSYRWVRYSTVDRRKEGHTAIWCRRCEENARHYRAFVPYGISRGVGIPWESYEDMKVRLLKEFGIGAYTRYGVTHMAPYKLSAAHREKLRKAHGELTPGGARRKARRATLEAWALEVTLKKEG